MEVIPAIDLRGGRCVRLFQGDYARETVFSDDPPAMARHWADLGARRLHLVDLDGAASGQVVNAGPIQEIAEAIAIPVELGGGLRDIESIRRVFSWGVDRVVLGTVAITDPGLVDAACAEFPGRIVVGVDARHGKVAINGWLETTAMDAAELVAAMAARGATRFIYTDISRDGTATAPNFGAIRQLIAGTGRPIIASGGVARVEHLVRLRDAGAEGAILGQALYTGAIDLGAALAAVS